MIDQKKQNEIEDLETLDSDRYENIFNVYEFNKGDEDSYYYFNILKKISIDDSNIDPEVFYYVKVDRKLPWTSISYNLYGTQHLWWLILLFNNIINPTTLPKIGDVYKVIKKEYVNDIVSQLSI
jgi:hypothetical protein